MQASSKTSSRSQAFQNGCPLKLLGILIGKNLWWSPIIGKVAGHRLYKK